jgi:DNA-binding winged helix-turn-helix (wHTH) protein
MPSLPDVGASAAAEALQSAPSAAIVSLRPGLWCDLEGHVLIRTLAGSHAPWEILLTAREAGILRILLHTMRTSRRYVTARQLADQLLPTVVLGTSDNPEHCIESSISTLRRKLGETPRDPRLLRGRRGIGYRLFPETGRHEGGGVGLDASSSISSPSFIPSAPGHYPAQTTP